MIPIIGLHRDDIKTLLAGQMLSLQDGGVNLNIIYMEARKQRSKKDIMDHVLPPRKKGGKKKKDKKETDNGVTTGNGIPKSRKGKRREFPLEFKKQIVQKVKDGEKIAGLAEQYGIQRSLIDSWRKGRGMAK